LGVIEHGRYVDMLMVEGHPLNDLTVLRDYPKNLMGI